jgi:hypothetical protein
MLSKPITPRNKRLLPRKNFFLFISIFSSPAFADHASIGLGIGMAAPIATESGITLPDGKFAVGLKTEYIKFRQFTDTKLQRLRIEDDDADLHSVQSLWSTSFGIAYGITDNLTVGARVPFIYRSNIREPSHGHHEDEHDEHGAEAPEIEHLGDIQGIGDTTFYGQYRFYKEGGSNVSALFGVKTPTGETNRSAANGEHLETEFQPGSGSWDGLMGFSFTQDMGEFSFDSSVLYTVVTEGSQATNLGDIFSYNFALSYRVLGQNGVNELPSKYGLDLVMEINGEWRDYEENSGIRDHNSGGNILYLSPGARVTVTDLVSMGISFGIPIARDVNGDQVDPDYRVVGNVTFSF